MCRTFSHYKSISYSENCKGVNKLKKKRTQTNKIVKITTNSSYVKTYTSKMMHNFYMKVFVFFCSGMFSSLVSNFFDFYIEKLMVSSGLDKKMKIIKIEKIE